MRFHLKEEGLQLAALQSGQGGLGDPGEVGGQRSGLMDGIVLAKGNKIDVFSGQKSADVDGGGGKAVVGGRSDEQRSTVAEMGFCGHCDAGVGDTSRQFAQGVAGTRTDDEQIQQLLRADGFGGLHGLDDPVVADALHFPHPIVGGTETGVSGGGAFRDDGDHPGEAGLDLLQGLHGFIMGTEGAAQGESHCFLFHIHPFRVIDPTHAAYDRS